MEIFIFQLVKDIRNVSNIGLGISYFGFLQKHVQGFKSKWYIWKMILGSTSEEVRKDNREGKVANNSTLLSKLPYNKGGESCWRPLEPL